MDRIKQVWTAVVGALEALFSFLGPAWKFCVAGLDRVRKSFVALVSSPAAWLSVAVIGVFGFWLGHVEGAAGKRALRNEVTTVSRQSAAKDDRITALQASNREAVMQIKRLKGEIEAMQAETARKPESKPVTAKPHRRVRRAPRVTVAAPAPSWWPFQ